MSCPHAVEVNDLTFRYATRGRPALRQVSFALSRGETALLLGPSGSGKSTLALCLNGLIPHLIEGEWSGRVIVDDLDVQKTPTSLLTQHVGIVFQDPESQFCLLTVEEEIAFGLENLALTRPEMEGRLQLVLRQLGLEPLRKTRLDRLSGGTKQRVALAASLAMGCHILVFDEPTANLDPRGTAEVFRLLADLKASGDYTILIIEHKLDDLMPQVDHLIVLGRDGTLVADGEPRQVLANQAETLRREGIWLPQMTQLALKLDKAGLRLEPIPLSIEEAQAALERQDGRLLWSTAATGPAVPARQAAPPGGSPPAISIRNLRFAYPGGQEVLTGANLEVAEGDFIALVGPNGAGKTTLALHLVDILRPPVGTVSVLGRDVRALSPLELTRQVGFVFQNPEHQFVTDTVFDEVAYSLRARREPEQKVRAVVQATLEEFGLERLARANPFTLSQGQKRRLSVATMLVVGQEIIILDEPTYGQDSQNTARLAEHLLRLNASGRTIVVITHDMQFVADHCRSAAVVLNGKIALQASTAELFAERELLTAAGLARPPLLELSLRLRQRYEHFPLLWSPSQFAGLVTVPATSAGGESKG